LPGGVTIVQPRRDLARHIGGDALGLALRAFARHEQEVREVEPRAPNARRRKLSGDFR
jgi:hypothetical protein